MVLNTFFELLQFSIGTRPAPESLPASREEWEELFAVTGSHNLLSVTFPAIDKLHDSVEIPLGVYSRWAMVAEKVQAKNKAHLACCRQLYERFAANGYRTCILKGQGVSAYYPHPELRQNGDIDIWVEGDRKKLVDFLRRRFKVDHIVYHHCEARIIKGINVEVHFTPSWMNEPFANRRLQRYFGEVAQRQFENFDDGLGFCVPTLRFQAVHLLIHIYRHVLDEGVGLRQLLDYCYVLEKLQAPDREAVVSDLKRLHLDRFGAGLMAVLKTVFAIDDAMLLFEPDMRQGEFLVEEIMVSGNFGRYDERNRHKVDESRFAHARRKMSRASRYLKYYPSEVLGIPVFMIKHYFWRLFNGYLKKN